MDRPIFHYLPGIIFTGIGCIFLLVSTLLLFFAINDWTQKQSYQAGQCTITAKRLDHQISRTTRKTGSTTRVVSTTDVYAPYFEFTVLTTNQQRYATHGYDGTSNYTSDYMGNQAIVDAYELGRSYQCWYNQANPTQAVLVRNPNWVLIFVGGGFLLGAGIFLLVGICMLLGLFPIHRISWYGGVRFGWNRDTF